MRPKGEPPLDERRGNGIKNKKVLVGGIWRPIRETDVKFQLHFCLTNFNYL